MKLSEQQEAILAILLHQFPWRMEASEVFMAIRSDFADVDHFLQAMEELYAAGLIDLIAVRGSDRAWLWLSDEGRSHCVARLAEYGLTIQQLRLAVQGQTPSTFNLGPFTFVDRILTCLADHDQQSTLRAMSITGEFAATETIQ